MMRQNRRNGGLAMLLLAGCFCLAAGVVAAAESKADHTLTAVDLDRDGSFDAVKLARDGTVVDTFDRTFTTKGIVELRRQVVARVMGQRVLDDSTVTELLAALSKEGMVDLQGIVHATGDLMAAKSVEEKNLAALERRWSDFVADTKVSGMAFDVHALVQYVLREAYLNGTEDLAFYADKVKFHNDVKSAVRDEVKKAREFAGQLRSADGTTSYQGYSFNTDYKAYKAGTPVKSRGMVVDTKKEVKAYTAELESTLSTAGEDAQLANVDLQNTLQKQQQVLQMVSNLSKMLHETAQAIVRNLK